MANDLSKEILSDIIVHMKYAKYLPEKKRRETWNELVDRNKQMHLNKFKDKEDVISRIEEVYEKFVRTKKVFPSMRSFQFAGKPIDINNSRMYNCSALPIDHPDAFSEIMFLLLGGTGVGVSVQNHHVRKLPPIKGVNHNRRRRYVITDDILGWSESIKVLVESYFQGKAEIDFDYRDIRPKGARLITSGGKAPGAEPLRECISRLTSIFERAIQERGINTQLKTIEAHDLCCFIADAVLAGGIRRAALISMFSFDDTDMLECKFGNWWELNPQRGRANNSVVLARHMAKKKDFLKIWEKVKASGAGEPGIIFTNDVEYLLNPCAEISLRPFSFCNLTSINAGNLESQEDLNERAKAASFLGTLQASYTDFHYLREIWKENTEKDSLIGASLTGIANGDILKLDVKQASLAVVEENKKWAPILGIKPAARCCAVKPEGTLSTVASTSSGIHAWHSPYFIRRIRVGKNESIYTYLSVMNPELVEDDFFRPESTAIISVPVKAPEGAIYRTETALDLLERVKKFHDDWIMPGHISGPNTHNVSATISVKDNEWDEVGEWMWTNRNCYNGLSVLPYDGGSYKQPPFEEIDEATFKKLYKHLTNVNLEGVVEIEDSTDHKGEVACSGGGCEIK